MFRCIGLAVTVETELLHRMDCIAFLAYPVEFREIPHSILDFIYVQSKISGQLVDGHRSVECLKNFEPAVVSVRQLLGAVLNRCSHAVPFLKFD